MCPSEVSDIEHSIWAAYQEDGVVVYGIASDDEPDRLRAFRERLGLTFPILVDTGGEVHAAYSMALAFSSAAYPQDWIVGTDGRVAYANHAFEPDEMRAIIARELSEATD